VVTVPPEAGYSTQGFSAWGKLHSYPVKEIEWHARVWDKFFPGDGPFLPHLSSPGVVVQTVYEIKSAIDSSHSSPTCSVLDL